jgi:hypothetical protein
MILMTPFEISSSKVLYVVVSIAFAARNVLVGVISQFESLQANNKGSNKIIRIFNWYYEINLNNEMYQLP